MSSKTIINHYPLSGTGPQYSGEMAEWTKARDSKSRYASRRTGVRIPLSPLSVIAILILILVLVSPLPAESELLRIVKYAHPLLPREGEALNQLITRPPRDNYRSRVNTAFRERLQTMARLDRVDTIRVLALRVEFVEDNSPLTTGNGKMDYAGFLDKSYGLLYDPPHTRRYFEKQMLALQNYYLLNSLGKCYITTTVKPDGLTECYQLPHDMLYYGDTISWQGIETGLTRLMRDAIKVADEDPTIRFSDYDLFVIFHAGSTGQTDLRYDSPFDLLTGTLNEGALQAYLGQPYVLADEGRTRITAATILPEMARQDTIYNGEVNIVGMTGLQGLIVHEFNHLLGGYDLYDVSYYSMGVGSWSLMGYGGWLGDWGLGVPPGTIPSMLDAFHRVLYGWVQPLVVNMPREQIPLFAAEMETSAYFRHRDTLNPTIIKVPITPKEYFLIENRQTDVRHKDTLFVRVEGGVPVSVGAGEYDFFQPGSGVLIWHIDEAVIDQFGPYNAINAKPWVPHKGVDLVEGDGIQDYDSWSGKASFDYQIFGCVNDPFFVGGYNHQLSATTTPNSEGYNGKTFITITVHSRPDTLMPVSIAWDLYQPGFPKNTQRYQPFNPAVIADIFQNGTRQIFVSDTAGRISAWNSDGTSFRSGSATGNFAQVPNATLHNALAIGDITGDERLEVICATDQGKVYAYTHLAGIVRGFPVTARDRITATPVLFDLNRDGKKEIIVGATDGWLYVWNGDGSNYGNFPVYLGAEIRAAVALSDLEHPQIVVLASDGKVFVVNPDGSMAAGFPKHIGQGSLYTYASPVVADIDRDGNREIIVVTSGGFNYQMTVLDFAGNVRFRSRDVVRNPFLGSPALADINDDGYLDILLAAKNGIYAFNRNGTLVSNYPFLQESAYSVTEVAESPSGGWLISFDKDFVFNSSPVIADLDGDGQLDVAIGAPQYGVRLFNGRTGRQLVYSPLSTQAGVSTTPLVADIDGDGRTELAVGSDDGLFHIWKLPGPASSIVWGSWLKDADHYGFYPESEMKELPGGRLPLVSKFYVYPNPAEKFAVVRYRLGNTTNATARVKFLDVSGLPVLEIPISADARTDNEARLDVRYLASGIYVVRLEVIADEGKTVLFHKLGIVR